VGERGDAVSLAAFIADERTSHHVPHAVACRALTVSESWFYKWNHRQHQPTPTERRRAELDTAVAEAFEAAHGLYGSPRIHADLRAGGWTVSEKPSPNPWPAKVWWRGVRNGGRISPGRRNGRLCVPKTLSTQVKLRVGTRG
jgi:hypothetical protein